MPRTGRPKIENPKSTQLGVRFSDESLEKLDYLADHYKTSRAGAIRESVEFTYSELRKGQIEQP